MFDWNIDPTLFKFGVFQIRYYGLLFAIGFALGYRMMLRIYRNEGKKIEELDTLLLYMIIGTIVGARLGHCLFYEPEIYLSQPLKILKVWEGGLASHGGTIGNIIALALYVKKTANVSFLWLIDRLAIPGCLVASFIRIGNFFNSEILGKGSDLPWAVIFSRYDSVPRHPSMLYESVSYFIIFTVLAGLYLKFQEKTPRGMLIGLAFTWNFSTRFFIEFTKINQVDFENTMPINMGQLLSLPFIALGLFLIYNSKKTAAHV